MARYRSSPTPHVQHRQVTFTGDVGVSAISPDGRSVAYAVGEPGREMKVMVADLSAGQASAIWTGREIYSVLWSREGSEILVSGELVGAKQLDVGTWIVPRMGGSARRVASGALSGLSPDGKALVMSQSRPPVFWVCHPRRQAIHQSKSVTPRLWGDSTGTRAPIGSSYSR